MLADDERQNRAGETPASAGDARARATAEVRGGDYCIPTIAGTLNARAETPEMDEPRASRKHELALSQSPTEASVS